MGRVAQSVERRSDKAKVLGSSPSMTTSHLLQPCVAQWTHCPFQNQCTFARQRKTRSRQDSNLRGQSPVDFWSTPLTAWVRLLVHGVSGLVVEWLPATESARVRFPAHAKFGTLLSKQATGRIELPTLGLQDQCSATELSRPTKGLSRELNPGPLAP